MATLESPQPLAAPFANSPPPNHAAVIAARSASTHGKLHKRNSSFNSLHSPDNSTYWFKRNDSPRVTYEEPVLDPLQPAPAVLSSSMKIKPYLRRLSLKDTGSNTLDLSRPTAENESLAGLGIYDYTSSNSASDNTFSTAGRTRHHRSTSTTSQFSTTSSLQRPTVPFAQPMRQTPRPYTPPIAKSRTASTIGTDHSEEAADVMSEEELQIRQYLSDPARRSTSNVSTPTIPPPLQIHTSSSMTRLGSISQTSLPTTAQSRRNTIRSIDVPVSPSSRTSVDKALNFIRGREDPVTRQAAIDAARAAFKQEEEAEESRAEKEAEKQREREERKRVKQEERQRRRSDAQERRTRARSNSSAIEEFEATSFAGKEYSDLAPVHSLSLPAPTTVGRPASRARTDTDVSARRAAKSRWLGFLAWFRTRLLRLGRRMGFEN